MSLSPELPKYNNPPVSEVYCGIYFDQLPNLTTPYIGLFWNKVKTIFNQAVEKNPLSPKMEKFGDKFTDFKVPDVLEYTTFPRIWFIGEDLTEVLQIQQDQFINNWRKIKNKDDYPHFQQISKTFYERLDTFKDFIQENNLGNFSPIQYELTYINHITKENGFSDPRKLEALFPDFETKNQESRFLKNADSFHLQKAFLLPERNGRLHLSIKNVFHKEYDQPIIIFQLVARGFNKPDESSMKAWFEMAHEHIVLGFEDLTDKDIQKNTWGKING